MRCESRQAGALGALGRAGGGGTSHWARWLPAVAALAVLCPVGRVLGDVPYQGQRSWSLVAAGQYEGTTPLDSTSFGGQLQFNYDFWVVRYGTLYHWDDLDTLLSRHEVLTGLTLATEAFPDRYNQLMLMAGVQFDHLSYAIFEPMSGGRQRRTDVTEDRVSGAGFLFAEFWPFRRLMLSDVTTGGVGAKGGDLRTFLFSQVRVGGELTGRGRPCLVILGPQGKVDAEWQRWWSYHQLSLEGVVEVRVIGRRAVLLLDGHAGYAWLSREDEPERTGLIFGMDLVTVW